MTKGAMYSHGRFDNGEAFFWGGERMMFTKFHPQISRISTDALAPYFINLRPSAESVDRLFRIRL